MTKSEDGVKYSIMKLVELTGYSKRYVSNLRQMKYTDRQILEKGHKRNKYKTKFKLGDEMLTIQELAKRLGYSRSHMASRIRDLPLDEALKPKDIDLEKNNYANQGDWDQLGRMTAAQRQKALDAIPGPSRFERELRLNEPACRENLI